MRMMKWRLWWWWTPLKGKNLYHHLDAIWTLLHSTSSPILRIAIITTGPRQLDWFDFDWMIDYVWLHITQQRSDTCRLGLTTRPGHPLKNAVPPICCDMYHFNLEWQFHAKLDWFTYASLAWFGTASLRWCPGLLLGSQPKVSAVA